MNSIEMLPVRSRKRPSAPPAFTLVELLVVIGIIAVLIAILLPVLGRAQEQSRRTKCLGNLHNMGVAMQMYANNFKGRLPNSTAPGSYWPTTSECLIYFANNYVNNPAAFWCPGDSDPVPQDITTSDYMVPDSAHTSYEFYSIWWPGDYGPILSRLSSRAPLVWDLDGGEASSPLHNHANKGGNVVFADGHAEWQDRKLWDGLNWPNPAQEFFPEPTVPNTAP